MAWSRKVGVELVADTSNLERGFARSARSATKFNREVSQLSRGALAGSGVFRTFGRSIAFASGGFIAAHTAAEFLTESINAAREAAVAQRSLAAQMKTSNESFKDQKERIDKVALSYGKFGFQNDEVIQSLTVLDRATGNINTSIRLQGGVADIARGKNIRLADAAAVVGKALSGQETALRRAVPGLSKTAHGADLVRLAFAKMSGQAAANTTASQKFASTLHDSEEIIGAALLPILNKYLGKLATWLQNMNESGKLQKDVNGFMDAAIPIVTGLAHAMQDLAAAAREVKKAWDKLPDFGKSKGLIGLLRSIPHHIGDTSLLDLLGVGGGGGGKPAPPLKNLFGPDQLNAFTAAAAKAKKAIDDATTPRRGPRPLSLLGRFNLAELQLAQAQLTKTLADDRRILVVEKAITEQQIAHAKSLKDKISLTQQLVGINDQILSIDQQHADALQQQKDAIKEQNQLLKDRADAIKAAILDRLQRQQTQREDKRAIQDAQEQLRLARAIGGPKGIQAAQRNLADALFQMRVFSLEGMQPKLRRLPGGQQQLGFGGVTVVINGVTDPDKVAQKVVEVLRRRQRRTSQQQRGAGQTATGAAR